MSNEGKLLYSAYLYRVEAYIKENPSQRLGQAMFNVLRDFDDDAQRSVHGGPLDPFHRREVVPDFLAWLQARWNAVS
jgi:hypothetical protein